MEVLPQISPANFRAKKSPQIIAITHRLADFFRKDLTQRRGGAKDAKGIGNGSPPANITRQQRKKKPADYRDNPQACDSYSLSA